MSCKNGPKSGFGNPLKMFWVLIGFGILRVCSFNLSLLLRLVVPLHLVI